MPQAAPPSPVFGVEPGGGASPAPGQLAQDDARRSFLRMVSHELRTPLNSILGFSEILSSELYGPLGAPQYKEYAEIIRTSGTRLLKLVNQVLEIARLEGGTMDLDLRQESLDHALDDVIDNLKDEFALRGVAVVIEGQGQLPSVRADARGLRVYLREFLSDPRVIEDQGLVWKLVLNGIILRVRPGKKAKDYLKIWNNERNESPLKTITRGQSDKLAEALADNNVVVDWAMRYGNPSMQSGFDALMAKGCDRILVVPLYPQYSAATTATVFDKAAEVMLALRAQPTLRFTPPYHVEPTYIEALAVSVETQLATLPFKPEVIVASFHGMPQKYVDKGDPYQTQCVATVEALRERLNLSDKELILTFQSRFGYDPWLQPYTDETMKRLAGEGVKRIAVLTPGFSADCLETLEEIAQENAEIFRHAGGEQFSFIPCLNDSEGGMDVIERQVRRELMGWL